MNTLAWLTWHLVLLVGIVTAPLLATQPGQGDKKDFPFGMGGFRR